MTDARSPERNGLPEPAAPTMRLAACGMCGERTRLAPDETFHDHLTPDLAAECPGSGLTPGTARLVAIGAALRRGMRHHDAPGHRG